MNEETAKMVVGNIEQLTKVSAALSFDEIESRLVKIKQARDAILWATLKPLLADIRSGMATVETADDIEAIVKEII